MRKSVFPVFILLIMLLSGCLERKFIIKTDPPGAQVFIDGELKGTSPYSQEFIYYGAREIICIHDGYKTLKTKEQIKQPFYQYFILDFFSEILPFTIKDYHEVNYHLEIIKDVDKEILINNANEMKRLVPKD